MRLWHHALIPYLDRQHLLGQHRECCALRGLGWGRKHATVDYAFKHKYICLYRYHVKVMTEMANRGYNIDPLWYDPNYHDQEIGFVYEYEYPLRELLVAKTAPPLIYTEHNDAYLRECIDLLKQKNASIDFDKIEKEFEIR